MRKSILLLLLLLSVGLEACLPKAQITSSPTTTSVALAPTSIRLAPTTVKTIPPVSVLSTYSGCTVVTQKPTPGPTPETIYPAINDADWVKGPATAKVTIIEYSDFQ